LSMVGAKYGWILNYDIATADYIHRVFAAIYVILTVIAIGYEVMRAVKRDDRRLPWFIIGRSGYQIFTFITTLIFIITGAIVWLCMDTNEAAAAFALFVHEKLTYFVIGSVIWHIYVKSHALVVKKRETTPIKKFVIQSLK
ncbi:MAG: hypothetical protein H7Y41_07250, partial [Hyphomonadaceae bacterium]|nr:hypothetical protein [Clostridia bacterium]